MLRSNIYSFSRFLLFTTLLLLASCSSKQPTDVNTPDDTETITIQSLSVMPVEVLDTGSKAGYTSTKQLEDGAAVLTVAIKDILQDIDGVSYLYEGQIESLLGNFQGNKREAARFIGKKIDADAILMPTINRYINRVGKTYSVSQPASVSFEFILIHVATGRVLCSGAFDETQEGLFSNLFSFRKASARGFKFITAEELTIEGLEQKFKDCKFLNQ